MTAFTNEDLGTIFTDVLAAARDEIRGISDPANLDRFWFFSYDPARTVEWNIYQFTDMLNLYKRKCREWEEMHNGSCCVVERVRDQYLMPKIGEFASIIKATTPNHVRVPSNREEAELMLLTAERYLRDNGFIRDEA